MNEASIGKKIKILRQDNDMRQIELARRLSVVNSTVSNWENDRRMPSIAELKRISDIFNVSLSYFEVDHPLLRTEMTPTKEADQSIETRPMGMVIPASATITLFSGIVMFVLSGIIIRYFALLCLFLGFFLVGWTLFSYVNARIRHRRVNSVILVIPISKPVTYVHPYTQSHCRRIAFRIRLATLILIFINVFVHLGNAWISKQLMLLWLDIVVSTFALVSLVFAFQRYSVVKSALIFKKSVNYYDVFKHMKHSIFQTMFLLDLTGFVVTTLLIVLNDWGSSHLWTSVSLLGAGSANVISSYLVLFYYHVFISRFELKYQ